MPIIHLDSFSRNEFYLYYPFWHAFMITVFFAKSYNYRYPASCPLILLNLSTEYMFVFVFAH